MSKKDHTLKNQLKAAEHQKPPRGEGAHSQPNDLADAPVNPAHAGQGHQRQPKP